MTVSRVLGDRNNLVSEETRQRVLDVVRELEYVPVAQPMMQSRRVETRIIGLVFDGTPFEGPFGLPTFIGLREGAKQYDYDLLTLIRDTPDWMLGREELQFLDWRCDGIIFISPQNRTKTIDALTRYKIPVVCCHSDDAPVEVPCVVSDNFDVMNKMTNLLIENGHTRIMHVGPCTERSDFKMRQEGYKKAMLDAGLEPIVFLLDNKKERSVQDFLKQIKQHNITALNCFSDTQAFYAWDVCMVNDIKIPQQMSITGMDNARHEAISRGLTTATVPFEQAGKCAFEIMMQLIKGDTESVQGVILPFQIIERTSVRRLN